MTNILKFDTVGTLMTVVNIFVNIWYCIKMRVDGW